MASPWLTCAAAVIPVPNRCARESRVLRALQSRRWHLAVSCGRLGGVGDRLLSIAPVTAYRGYWGGRAQLALERRRRQAVACGVAAGSNRPEGAMV